MFKKNLCAVNMEWRLHFFNQVTEKHLPEIDKYHRTRAAWPILSYIIFCFLCVVELVCLVGVEVLDCEMPVVSLYALLCCYLDMPKAGQTLDTLTHTHSGRDELLYTHLCLSLLLFQQNFFSFFIRLFLVSHKCTLSWLLQAVLHWTIYCSLCLSQMTHLTLKYTLNHDDLALQARVETSWNALILVCGSVRVGFCSSICVCVSVGFLLHLFGSYNQNIELEI